MADKERDNEHRSPCAAADRRPQKAVGPLRGTDCAARHARSEKRTLEERVRELDAELARMQLTEGLAGGGSNREKARARVNRLMREVDKCIALLGQPLAAPTTQEAE